MTETVLTGTVLKGIGGFYYVLGDDGAEYTLRAQSKIRHIHVKPMVGDRVEFVPGSGEEEGWLKSIQPRRTELLRPPVSNIDAVVLTLAASTPQADELLIDRLMLFARGKNIACYLAVNKCDEDGDNAAFLAEQYRGACDGVFAVSAETGEGLDALRSALKGKIHAFAGQSGVGKSSLINALYGFHLDTGSISSRIERGKHTTRSSCLIPVDGGGSVLDTPGFSLLESEIMEPEKLQELYPEFLPYAGKCRFSPCMHDAEPDCAVKEALGGGLISRPRYERYRTLLAEMKERWNKRYD